MIIIASDHAGFARKNELLESGFLDEFDSDIIDMNTEFDGEDDYPDVALDITAVQDYQKATIIGLCGSGQGMCMALNKIPGLRCGFGYNLKAAQMMRIDNDANGICFSARSQTLEEIQNVLKAYFGATFSGLPRHQRRVQKLDRLSKISDN